MGCSAVDAVGWANTLEKRLKTRPKTLGRALDKLSPVTYEATMNSMILRPADGELIVRVRE